MSRYLFLDQSSTRTGWAASDTSKILGSGFVVLKGVDWVDRLRHLRTFIHQLIDHYVPSILVIEATGAFSDRSQKTKTIMASLEFLILDIAKDRQLEVVMQHPKEIKAGITANGSASKQDVLFQVERLMGIKPSNHDHADALAAAWLFLKGQIND